MAHRTVRIFVSSPSDVRPERLIAERIIQKLSREYGYHARLEAVLWEREPLTAAQSFQKAVEMRVRPRDTDLVIVILWSRLGHPLCATEYVGPISGRPVTGTEWEWEDALAGNRERAVPDLLLYRKTLIPEAKLTSREQVEEQLRQKEQVEEFITRWTRAADGRAFTAAYRDFDTAADFEVLLEEHLRRWLKGKLDTADTPGIAWHAGNPYRGLAPFELEHAQIFYGRARARNEVRELLTDKAAAGLAFVLIMGASGSGKSSLVKAGLLPDLKVPGMINCIGVVRHAILRPSDDSEDIIRGLASSLLADDALPELRHLRYSVDSLASLVGKGEVQIALEQGLRAAAAADGLAEGAEARLLLIVDQMEELFTLDGFGHSARAEFVAALERLASSDLVWVVATMRSDFFDRIATMPTLARLSAGSARYLLLPPDASEIGQIVRGPAQEAGLRFEADSAGVSLDETIRAAATEDPHALPLLSFVLEQLWHCRSDSGVLTHAAYQRIGRLEGALGRYAEGVIGALPRPVADAFPGVLRALVTVAEGAEGRPTARRARIDQFGLGTPARDLVEALVTARLLVAEEGGASPTVRLVHEALLSHWARAADQVAEDREDLQRRARIEAALALWEEQARDRSLLLRSGPLLAEAEDLLCRRSAELDPAVVRFVGASVAAQRARTRARIAVAAAISIVLGAGVVAGYSVFDALQALQTRRAAAERTDVAGTLIAYAGSPGENVSDGDGEHGLYTEALLEEMSRPDLTITEAILAAHDSVRSRFRGTTLTQTPQLSSSLNSDIFLHHRPSALRARVFIVGAKDYSQLPKLKNPVNDAEAMAKLFTELGYEVDLHLNPTSLELQEAANQFLKSLVGESIREPFRPSALQPSTEHSVRTKAQLLPVGLVPQDASSNTASSAQDTASAVHLSCPGLPGGNWGIDARQDSSRQHSIAIVYFAGSGLEIDGQSLFPAIDAPSDDVDLVKKCWFNVSHFVDRLKMVSGAQIAILDFCRDDPFVD